MRIIVVSLLLLAVFAAKQTPAKPAAKIEESTFTKRDWTVFDQGWFKGYDSGWFALIDAQFD